ATCSQGRSQRLACEGHERRPRHLHAGVSKCPMPGGPTLPPEFRRRGATPGFPPKACEMRDQARSTWFDTYPERAARQCVSVRSCARSIVLPSWAPAMVITVMIMITCALRGGGRLETWASRGPAYDPRPYAKENHCMPMMERQGGSDLRTTVAMALRL